MKLSLEYCDQVELTKLCLKWVSFIFLYLIPQSSYVIFSWRYVECFRIVSFAKWRVLSIIWVRVRWGTTLKILFNFLHAKGSCFCVWRNILFWETVCHWNFVWLWLLWWLWADLLRMLCHWITVRLATHFIIAKLFILSLESARSWYIFKIVIVLLFRQFDVSFTFFNQFLLLLRSEISYIIALFLSQLVIARWFYFNVFRKLSHTVLANNITLILLAD